MDLKRPAPSHRSYEQIRNHYLVEKAIAEKLKESDREERKLIYATMYDELFSKVPDHPRLTRRKSSQLTSSANEAKLSLIRRFLDESAVLVEFAPGDCRFGIEVARHVKYVYGVDISDQRNPADAIPDNFTLIVYDGYSLDEIESNSVDIVFSDQLIEHFHPDDTKLHFELVYRILKKGGKYIFRTPQVLTGPHDVSQYFSDEAECFHLKEWTYIEIRRMLKDLDYSGFHTYWNTKGMVVRLPYIWFTFFERVLGLFPKRHIRGIAKYLVSPICGVAVK